ncbi:MAG: hypothetical protein MZV70_36100 [Desulfobacterales bacterium]|nr:hypothetical protein [Desulfobacterales bacterium]
MEKVWGRRLSTVIYGKPVEHGMDAVLNAILQAEALAAIFFLDSAAAADSSIYIDDASLLELDMSLPSLSSGLSIKQE